MAAKGHQTTFGTLRRRVGNPAVSRHLAPSGSANVVVPSISREVALLAWKAASRTLHTRLPVSDRHGLLELQIEIARGLAAAPDIAALEGVDMLCDCLPADPVRPSSIVIEPTGKQTGKSRHVPHHNCRGPDRRHLHRNR
jgi:hypothetical protein